MGNITQLKSKIFPTNFNWVYFFSAGDVECDVECDYIDFQVGLKLYLALIQTSHEAEISLTINEVLLRDFFFLHCLKLKYLE